MSFLALGREAASINCPYCKKCIEHWKHSTCTYTTYTKEAHEAMLKEEKSKRCECGGMREERQNSQTGKKFLGCSNYPNCKKTKSIK